MTAGQGMILAQSKSKMTQYLQDTEFHFINTLKMRRSFVNLSGFLNAVTKVVTGCLRMTKDSIFVVF